MIRKTVKLLRKYFNSFGSREYKDIRRTTYWFLFIPIFVKDEILKQTGYQG